MKLDALFELLEPEEFVGKLWHGFLGKAGRPDRFPAAAVALEDVRKSALVIFRGLGGAAGVSLSASGPGAASHRPGLRERIGGRHDIIAPRRDDDALYLPPTIDCFPAGADNRSLYIWLAAFFAHLPVRAPAPVSLESDIRFLRDIHDATAAALKNAPGLAKVHTRLSAMVLASRPVLSLPPVESAVERIIRFLLGQGEGSFEKLCSEALACKASNYFPFLPVILWGRAETTLTGDAPAPDEADHEGESGDGRHITRKASRQNREETERNDYLALNRFEKMLTMADSMNIARPVEDDEQESAQKAAEDSAEIILSRHRKKASTRLKLDLELAPASANDGALTEGLLYPEWDWRRRSYRPDYCRVLVSRAQPGAEIWQPSPEVMSQARRLRRQFQALQIRNITLRGQVDGDELDLEAVVRSRADFRAGGILCDRNYMSTRKQGRDLAVALLVDSSLSTDAWVHDRRVIDIAREAALLFCEALDAGGDANAVFSFSSNSRKKVHVNIVKDFGEDLTPRIIQRIGGVKPGHYTRLGAALRHVSAEVQKQQASQRMLLVLTDGKPNDIDHYEGRFGVEDTRRAVREARRNGVQVFGMTIDARARSYFPVLFGRSGYAIVADPARLPVAVPKLLKQAKLKN